MDIVRKHIALHLSMFAMLFLSGVIFVSNTACSDGKALAGVGDSDYPPHTFIDHNTNQPAGFDVDIVKALAPIVKQRVDIRLMNWEKAQKCIGDSQADFIISTLYTKDREKRFDFTIPYHDEYYAIFASKSSSITKLSDLKGKEVIGLIGDASIDKFIKPMGLYKKAVYVDSLPIALILLNSGKHDFVVAPYNLGMDTIAKQSLDNIHVVGPPILPSSYRLAVKKGNTALLTRLNEAIDQIKHTPKYKELNLKWFKYHRNEHSSTAVILKYAVYAGVVTALAMFVFMVWSWTLKKQVNRKTLDLSRSQLALQESEGRLKSLIASMDDLVFVMDKDLVFKEYYQSCNDKLYVKPEMFIGKRLDAIGLPDDSYAIVKNALMQTLHSGNPAKAEYSLDIQNALKWFDLQVTSSYGSDGVLAGLTCVVRDITERKQIEDALRASQSQLTDVIDFLPDATFAIDTNKRVIIWNKAIEQMTGIPADEMIGKGDHLYTVPFYGDARQHLMDMVLDGYLDIETKYPSITRESDAYSAIVFCNALNDNKGMWAYTKASPLHDQSGNVIGAIESVRDITERKQAEDELKEKSEELEASYEELIATTEDLQAKEKALISEKEFTKALLESVPGFLYVYDEQGTLVRWNKKHELMTGYSAEELSHMNITQWYDGEELAKVNATIEEVYETGYGEVEANLIVKDGSKLLVHVNGVRLDIDGKTYLTGVGLDITKRKQAEDEIKHNSGLITSLLDSIPDLIFFKDVNGVYLGCNPAFTEFVGHSRDKIIGSTDYDLFDKETADSFRDYDQRMLALLESRNNEEWITYPDGRMVMLDTLKTPYWGPDGTLIGVLGIGRDITDRKLAEEALRDSEATVRSITDSAQDAILMMNARGQIVFWNPAAERVLGYTADEALGLNLHKLLAPERYHDAHNQAFPGFLQSGRGSAIGQNLELHAIRKDQKEITVALSLSAFQRNNEWGAVGILRDITAQKEAERALREAWNIIERSPVVAFSWGNEPNWPVLFVSTNVEMLLGYCAEDFISGDIDYINVIHPDDLNLVEEEVKQYSSDNEQVAFNHKPYRVITKGGQVKWIDENTFIRRDENSIITHYEGTIMDITAQKQAEYKILLANSEIDNINRQLEVALLAAHQHAKEVEFAKEQIEVDAAEMDYQARHDTLTGLSNRLYFSEELASVIDDHKTNGKQCAVLFIDLDKFKMVNDTMGHNAGDILLVQTAARLGSCLRSGDILARMGGDEFNVLLKNIKSINDAAVVAQRMLNEVSKPYEISGSKLVIGASIGVSIYPDNALDADGLLRYADTAMYKAKELGRNNCQFFSDEISQESHARVEMERDLRLALENNELQVYYQPIIDVNTMNIVGAEALLRWDHPDKGMVSPGLFIPVAEETGMIVQMGKMVLETACKQCKAWQDSGYDDFEISVNVSPAQLSEIEIINVVHGALSDVGLHPSCLKLEVTETVLAKNDNDEVDILSILRSLGLVICLDDFGIGYSSLSRLNNLPIGHMKIDGYFIRNIVHKQKDRAMTESIIVMAHNLGIRVTAEWIEDEAQMATIRSLGCDYAQGYLVSPALSADAFEVFLSEWGPTLENTPAA